MCIECRQFTCPGACPNAMPDVCGVCESCNEGIYAGDEISMAYGAMYHRDCMYDNWQEIFEVSQDMAENKA